MNIVCGDALGVSCGTWIAFWNGAIGAFVGAVLGGLVALLVVRLTARQAAKHAEQARQITAISELVANFEALILNDEAVEEATVADKFLGLRAAWVRLYISGPDAVPLAMTVEKWPHRLYRLSNLLALARHEESPEEEAQWDELADYVNTFASCGVHWTHARASKRRLLLASVQERTEKLLRVDLDAREAVAYEGSGEGSVGH